ncbi:MAG: hypothetical protein WKG00_27795 [Polyangiaceae bacterium]
MQPHRPAATLSPDDPTVIAQVERALAPYKDLLTPALLAVFREELEHALTTDPIAVDMVKRLRPAPVVQRSGERDADAEAAGAEDTAGAMRGRTRGSAG